MSLIIKTTLFYLLLSMLVFGVGGVVAYNLIKEEVEKETDFELKVRVDQIIHAMQEGISERLLVSEKVSIVKVDHFNPVDTNFAFADTLAAHPYLKDRQEAYRTATVVSRINGEDYRISMMDVFIESDDIYDSVVRIMSRLFALLGITLLLFSFLITRWLFLPFKKTLEQIQSFNLKKQEALALPVTTTKEFKQMNTFIAQMVAKARQDYLAVKEFSENASHEIQTPLSVTQGKLELLLETPDLSLEQLQLIQAAQQSLNKLSKLGEALLLLTKIENKEFATQKKINFSNIVHNNTHSFEELACMKGLTFRQSIKENVLLEIDPSLADILVNNLLKNTIRHNVEDGWVSVELDSEKLVVTNTGLVPKVPTRQLLERFQKSQHTNGSLGLGLSIVNKICTVSNFDLNYDFEEGIHRISVKFC